MFFNEGNNVPTLVWINTECRQINILRETHVGYHDITCPGATRKTKHS